MSNSNKKYEDMAEHTKNNRPEKKLRMAATTYCYWKTSPQIYYGPATSTVLSWYSSASF